MRQHIAIAALVAATGLSTPAFAQDSVSSAQGGLPGDALDPWAQGCAAYVVDLAPVETSWGNVFGVAPLLKSSRTNSENFNSLGSSVAISPDVLTGSTFSRPSYAVWSTPGAGVGPANTAPGSVSPTGTATRFAVAMTEFSTTDMGAGYTGLLGAVVSFSPSNPNRLFVDRRVAAVNTADAFTFQSSDLGGVWVDASGNMYYRGEAFGASGPNPVSGQNIFRTRLLDRDCGEVNLISSGGTLDATDWLLANDATTTTVPAGIPASVAGGNGVYGGPNFDAQYVYGATPGSIFKTQDHFDVVTNHRGSLGGTSHLALGSGVWTYAVNAQNPTTGLANVINLFSVNASGAVLDAKGFTVPTTVTDNATGFTVVYTPSMYESRHHTGPTAFRGGVGTVAVGNDQEGRTLIAATIQELGNASFISPQIVVGRFDDPDGPVEWTTAAYIDVFNLFTTSEGKPIYDENGVAIGNLAHMGRIPSAPQGPSMSAPAIDSVGNVWFLSTVELYGEGFEGASAFRTALIRAVYNPDEFSYDLELVLNVADVIEGQNSGVDYRLNFLSTTTGSATPAPESLWSSSVADHAWNNTPTAGLDTADTITNGGVIISGSIIYDTDGDGRFNDPTSNIYNPAWPADEAYDVAIYVGHYGDGAAPCPGDFNGSGTVDIFDLLGFIDAYTTGSTAADFNNSGTVDIFDLLGYLDAYNAGCP